MTTTNPVFPDQRLRLAGASRREILDLGTAWSLMSLEEQAAMVAEFESISNRDIRRMLERLRAGGLGEIDLSDASEEIDVDEDPAGDGQGSDDDPDPDPDGDPDPDPDPKSDGEGGEDPDGSHDDPPPPPDGKVPEPKRNATTEAWQEYALDRATSDHERDVIRQSSRDELVAAYGTPTE